MEDLSQRVELLLHPRVWEQEDGGVVTVRPGPSPVNSSADKPPTRAASRPGPAVAAKRTCIIPSEAREGEAARSDPRGTRHREGSSRTRESCTRRQRGTDRGRRSPALPSQQRAPIRAHVMHRGHGIATSRQCSVLCRFSSFRTTSRPHIDSSYSTRKGPRRKGLQNQHSNCHESLGSSATAITCTTNSSTIRRGRVGSILKLVPSDAGAIMSRLRGS